jgi:adenosylcobyric acid synthase
MAAHALFVGGTSSNAGKSWIATAICASLRRRGLSVAPFKAQNMSNNSFPCREGGEIGRAQVAQAEACGLEPETAMNPILLKPNGDGTSQVIVRGRMWKTLRARDYYAQFDTLIDIVLEAYRDLSARFEVIVIEGAGSVSELNLRPHDLVNLGLVTRIGASWILVADIERGGVFGSVIGTASLLSAEERQLFRGFLVNKFRGDLTLFEEGARMIADKIGAPCLGIFPYADGLRVDAEDSLALDARRRTTPPAGARIAIVHFPRISNATDFRLLTWADWLTNAPADDYDFIILPGSKHTASDLAWLRARGFERWIHDQRQRGATVIGVCGGFQMLGQTIADPDGVESADIRPDNYSVPGLGLLPVRTVLTSAKTTRQRRATLTSPQASASGSAGVSFTAYEIHLGETRGDAPAAASFATLDDGSAEGIHADRVIGTYLHGAFEHPAVCTAIFGVPVEAGASKAEEYERLADWFDQHARHADDWLPRSPRMAASKR